MQSTVVTLGLCLSILFRFCSPNATVTPEANATSSTKHPIVGGVDGHKGLNPLERTDEPKIVKKIPAWTLALLGLLIITGIMMVLAGTYMYNSGSKPKTVDQTSKKSVKARGERVEEYLSQILVQTRPKMDQQTGAEKGSKTDRRLGASSIRQMPERNGHTGYTSPLSSTRHKATGTPSHFAEENGSSMTAMASCETASMSVSEPKSLTYNNKH